VRRRWKRTALQRWEARMWEVAAAEGGRRCESMRWSGVEGQRRRQREDSAVVRAAASIGRRDRMLVRRQSGRRLIRSGSSPAVAVAVAAAAGIALVARSVIFGVTD
jgi:hypothetical protein